MIPIQEELELLEQVWKLACIPFLVIYYAVVGYIYWVAKKKGRDAYVVYKD